jgi:hypothetical protein
LDVPDDMLYLSNFRGFQLFRILQDAPHLSVSKNPGSASNFPQISWDDPWSLFWPHMERLSPIYVG